MLKKPMVCLTMYSYHKVNLLSVKVTGKVKYFSYA